MLNLREEDTLVLILGETGSRKSTLINYAACQALAFVGHDLTSEPQSISYFVVDHPIYPERRHVLVEVPGFDSPFQEDREILDILLHWLKASSFPRSRMRVAIIYLVEIDQRCPQNGKHQMSPQKLCIPGLAEHLVIATTKWGHVRRESGKRRESDLSNAYGHTIHSFRDTSESAWGIVDRASASVASLLEVQSKLASALPVPRLQPALRGRLLARPRPVLYVPLTPLENIYDNAPKPGRRLRVFFAKCFLCLALVCVGAMLSSILFHRSPLWYMPEELPLPGTLEPLPGGDEEEAWGKRSLVIYLSLCLSATCFLLSLVLQSRQPTKGGNDSGIDTADDEDPEATEKLLDVNITTRLEQIHARLTRAFDNTFEYKRLLSCQGHEAQALLDTLQLILRLNRPEGRLWRNLVIATKRLSSKTNLCPAFFILGEVKRLDERPVVSGGYADIHKGTFRGKEVCLKVIRIYQTSKYEHIVKIISREAILWAQLSHPNLLPLYGLYRLGQQLSLVSPWAVNGNVVDFLSTHPTANRVLLAMDIAQGVRYLHENDIVHGDLKGANILIDGSFRAYVADFGLSSVEDPEILHWDSQSAAASTGGTIRWQAPELFMIEVDGDEDEDEIFGPRNTKATDMYAWACVCYEIFTGRLPFFEYPREHTVAFKVGGGARPTLPASLKVRAFA